MLRIYANQWHVYAGLAILNPSARTQIDQYSKSVTELFKLMIAADKETLRARVYSARDTVFGEEGKERSPIFLSEDVLDQFSLGRRRLSSANNESPTSANPSPTTYTTPQSPQNANYHNNKPKENSHLSLLAMVDCWAHLGIHPFVHLDLAATPIFRLWFGVAEYLFRSPERLDAAIDAALYDVSHRSDDLEFVVAARGWSQCVSFGSFDLYKKRFLQTGEFFESRFEDAAKVGSSMIQAVMADARGKRVK